MWAVCFQQIIYFTPTVYVSILDFLDDHDSDVFQFSVLIRQSEELRVGLWVLRTCFIPLNGDNCQIFMNMVRQTFFF